MSGSCVAIRRSSSEGAAPLPVAMSETITTRDELPASFSLALSRSLSLSLSLSLCHGPTAHVPSPQLLPETALLPDRLCANPRVLPGRPTTRFAWPYRGPRGSSRYCRTLPTVNSAEDARNAGQNCSPLDAQKQPAEWYGIPIQPAENLQSKLPRRLMMMLSRAG